MRTERIASESGSTFSVHIGDSLLLYNATSIMETICSFDPVANICPTVCIIICSGVLIFYNVTIYV